MEREHIGKYMKMIHISMQKDFNRMVLKDDLTHAQCELLGYLERHLDREVNPVDLEREFYISRPTVAGLLKRLEAKGFLIFEESSKDKRYKQIILTEKALDHRERMWKHITWMEERMSRELSVEEQETLVRLLKQVLKNVAE